MELPIVQEYQPAKPAAAPPAIDPLKAKTIFENRTKVLEPVLCTCLRCQGSCSSGRRLRSQARPAGIPLLLHLTFPIASACWPANTELRSARKHDIRLPLTSTRSPSPRCASRTTISGRTAVTLRSSKSAASTVQVPLLPAHCSLRRYTFEFHPADRPLVLQLGGCTAEPIIRLANMDMCDPRSHIDRNRTAGR